MTDTIELVIQHSRVGGDRLTVTSPDKQGNNGLIVVVEQFTKHVAVYLSKGLSAKFLALVLFRYFATFEIFEEVWSDPGSDLMSETIEQLNSWVLDTLCHLLIVMNQMESRVVTSKC